MSKDNKFIEVQIFSNPDDLSEIGVVFRSNNGSSLNAQELLDAFSDALLVDETVPCLVVPEAPYDA